MQEAVEGFSSAAVLDWPVLAPGSFGGFSESAVNKHFDKAILVTQNYRKYFAILFSLFPLFFAGSYCATLQTFFCLHLLPGSMGFVEFVLSLVHLKW